MSEPNSVSELDNVSEPNNADVRFINHFAFYDIKVVDEEEGIWKGIPILPVAKDDEHGLGFFSRRYNREDSDIDRMIEEYYIRDKSILGVEFLLVPREKLLFAYNPPSFIMKPRRFNKARGGGGVV